MDMRFVVLLLLGFAGFLRRSELRSIQVTMWSLFGGTLTTSFSGSAPSPLCSGLKVSLMGWSGSTGLLAISGEVSLFKGYLSRSRVLVWELGLDDSCLFASK